MRSRPKKPHRPLRKIVDRKNYRTKDGLVTDLIIEVLECGHEQNEKQDHYGPTNASRRRCRKCGEAPHAE